MITGHMNEITEYRCHRLIWPHEEKLYHRQGKPSSCWWIPLTKVQWRGKMFHLMTAPCAFLHFDFLQYMQMNKSTLHTVLHCFECGRSNSLALGYSCNCRCAISNPRSIENDQKITRCVDASRSKENGKNLPRCVDANESKMKQSTASIVHKLPW